MLVRLINAAGMQAMGIQDQFLVEYLSFSLENHPVGDKPLYHSMPSGIIAEQGHLSLLDVK